MSTTGKLPATYVKGFHDEAQVRRMEYRIFGKTGLEVSKISFGGGALCANYGFDFEEGIKTVHQALKSGINYIDTAPWYGQGRSEEVLGHALKDVPRESYYIATKVARYELDYEHMFDFSAKKTRESVEKSLKLLGLDYVDVIQIHDIEFAKDLDIVLNETLPTLEQLVKEGKAKYIGVTGYPLSVLKECITRAEGRFDAVLCYARYTLTDDTLLEYLDYFKSQELGIVCAAAHALRLLTNAGPPAWHPASDEQKQLVRKAANVCRDREVELGKLAMHFAMQLDGVSTFLTGMQTREWLELNLDAFHNGLSGKEQEVLQYLRENIFTKPFNWEGNELKRYWAALKRT
ncbi:L-galactose dehydrogenase [Scaptodrosophila lebanonensis]|uniref:L-galactose dehydrogenase n=1 Tax=Drosophila lebanonensis TaxID=7225 RepID=A0A6J2TG30_DROLE|nr:L-galactose dehydrogenase [Scaptodrosophila lebanonensis]